MATRRNARKQRQSSPGRRRLVNDDLSLADELLRVSRKEHADLVAGWKKFLKQLGIRAKPTDAKKLRERLLRKGFNPESSEFSQGISAMREE